jgi:hypothetical protein
MLGGAALETAFTAGVKGRLPQFLPELAVCRRSVASLFFAGNSPDVDC